jgi:hypothetical protein
VENSLVFEMQHTIPKKEGITVTPHVHFPLGAMGAATFFVNHSLRIEWIKVDQSDRLSRAIAAEWTENGTGTIFDLLLHASLKELFYNWQPLFSFIYKFLKQSTPERTFNRVAPTLSIGMVATDNAKATPPAAGKIGRIDSCSFQLEDDNGKMQNKRLYGVVLTEGTVFVLNDEPETATGRQLADSKDKTGKTPFSVISVRLDNSDSIVGTLLPEAYYQLIKRIWE